MDLRGMLCIALGPVFHPFIPSADSHQTSAACEAEGIPSHEGPGILRPAHRASSNANIHWSICKCTRCRKKSCLFPFWSLLRILGRQSGHKREVEFFRACFGNASTACRHNQTLASEFLEDFSDIFWLSVYSRRLLHLGFCRAVMVDERGTQQFLNYEL